MSIVVIANLSAKEESLEELKNYLKETLPDTRSFEGCQGVQLYENKEFPTKLTIHAKWVSEEAQKKYVAWRMETGALNKLMTMLSEPASMPFYNIIDE
jgi:quinol monooxygenase YgiN